MSILLLLELRFGLKESRLVPNYLYGGLYSALERTSIDESRFPSGLTPQQLADERILWQNAIDFYVAFGSTHRRNDIAYRGILYQCHLTVLGEYLAYLKPEYVNFDIEDWISKANFLTYIGNSVNAENARLPGESDGDLYDRLAASLLTDIRVQFDANSPESEILYFGSQSSGNNAFSYYRWDVMERELGPGLIPQPEIYRTVRSPGVVQQEMRCNRLNLDQGTHLIPMPTHGCYGEYDAYLALEWCLQLFGNGATGFQLYSDMYVDDADDLLYLKECVDMVAPFEDIIMDGEVAFHDLQDVSESVVVGAVRLNDEYFISVSPDYPAISQIGETSGSFSLRIPDAQFVWVYDAREDRYLKNEISLSDGVLTVEFPELRSTALHITTENERFFTSFVLAIAAGVGSLAVLGVALLVMIVLILFACLDRIRVPKT